MRSARSKAAAALGACLLVSGCADYMANRDSVTLGVGDAPQANLGIETTNPFPPEAWDTRINADGRVVAKAQRLYAAGGASTTTDAVPTTTTTGVTTTTN